MTLLLVGMVLWVGAHFFKRLAPERRAAMGDSGKAAVAITVLVSLVLIVLGYRAAPVVAVFTPLPGIGHLNNLLMLLAMVVFGLGAVKGVLWTKIRHPQLTAVTIWAFGHLLVNGDLASLVLFGGMLFWAVAQMGLINRAEGKWLRPAPGGWGKDGKAVVIGLIFFAVAAGVHIWLGHNPFLGTYA